MTSVYQKGTTSRHEDEILLLLFPFAPALIQALHILKLIHSFTRILSRPRLNTYNTSYTTFKERKCSHKSFTVAEFHSRHWKRKPRRFFVEKDRSFEATNTLAEHGVDTPSNKYMPCRYTAYSISLKAVSVSKRKLTTIATNGSWNCWLRACVETSIPLNQHPYPGWLWYQPTTWKHLSRVNVNFVPLHHITIFSYK